MRWLIKACPHCGGDVYLDEGLDSYEARCLQCSRLIPAKVALRHQSMRDLRTVSPAHNLENGA